MVVAHGGWIHPLAHWKHPVLRTEVMMIVAASSGYQNQLTSMLWIASCSRAATDGRISRLHIPLCADQDPQA
jgi:hypothetical protein